MKLLQTLILLCVTITIFGCDAFNAEEVARIDGNQLSTPEDLQWKTTEIDLLAGDKIHFWAEMDMYYEGDLALRFQVDIIQNGDSLGMFELDPMDKDVTMREFRTEIDDEVEWRYSGRMGTMDIEEDGHYVFRAILISSPNESLQLNKSNFVIKKSVKS